MKIVLNRHRYLFKRVIIFFTGKVKSNFEQIGSCYGRLGRAIRLSGHFRIMTIPRQYLNVWTSITSHFYSFYRSYALVKQACCTFSIPHRQRLCFRALGTSDWTFYYVYCIYSTCHIIIVTQILYQRLHMCVYLQENSISTMKSSFQKDFDCQGLSSPGCATRKRARLCPSGSRFSYKYCELRG